MTMRTRVLAVAAATAMAVTAFGVGPTHAAPAAPAKANGVALSHATDVDVSSQRRYRNYRGYRSNRNNAAAAAAFVGIAGTIATLAARDRYRDRHYGYRGYGGPRHGYGYAPRYGYGGGPAYGYGGGYRYY